MSKFARIFIVLLLAMSVGGCANSSIKPVEIICPLIGGVAGVGIAAGTSDGGEAEAAMAIAGLVGATVGYFACRD